MKSFIPIIPVICIGLAACEPVPNTSEYDYEAPFADMAPVIDGKGDDEAWEKAEWRPINQVWLGGGNASSSNLTPPSAADYSGRFKIVWTEDRLYYLVEIKDTFLVHGRAPYKNPEEDDCLELFINSNGLGGNHLNNNIAIAYHMKLDEENAMDYVSGQSNSLPFQNGYIKRNHHLNYKIGNLDLPNKKSIDGTNIFTWEVEMKIYPATLPINDNPETTPPAEPMKLTEGKTMGFAVAYCNAGKSNKREYFMGSMFIPGSDKNVAYQDASVFAKLHLKK
ncbi:MAG: CBM9 family sugar-binding protein [Treponema sp.]|nr:CBM9 family sugar-binding protein [Treponema sp.]MCL2251476.1 CBM9 family sugar-binding protein [Treponema sp.]